MSALSGLFGKFDRFLRVILVSLALSGIGLLVIFFWSPEVEPLAPGDLTHMDSMNSEMTEADAGAADEFVTRPLFLESRRPLQVAEAPAPTIKKAQPPASMKVLENVTLLGVFSSGSSEGVILQENGGDRRRVLVGERTGEWTLARVEPRAAVFKSGSTESRVTMSLLAIGKRKGGVTFSAAKDQAGDPSAEGQQEPAGPKTFVPTFGSLLEQKRQSRAKAASGPDDTTETQPDAASTEKRDQTL